ncbi:transposable element Tc1 transposase [Trichonephila clavipes]|nr:transposable element Tc1 transposase [Trichonephila clavipes]
MTEKKPHHRIQAHYKQLSELEGGWGCTVFSDESHCQPCPNNHRRCVWRPPEKRADLFTITRHTSPQPGVMVRGAVPFDSRTLLVVIRGTLAAQQ